MTFYPKQAANTCIRRAKRFLELADNHLPVNRAKNDLRRMALVMAVAAIDSYMHSLILRRIAAVRRSADLPKSLARLDIPFSEFARLAGASIKAQREGRTSRPWVQVKSSLQERLLKETFQSYDQVAIALSIAGVEKCWSKITAELGETVDENKEWLNNLVKRRNQIVHEGDMKRAPRPQKLRFNDINQAEAEQEVEWVETLIMAIDKVVERQP